MNASQNSDHIINLNELGVDLEKTINSKIANRYIMSENKIKTLQLATFGWMLLGNRRILWEDKGCQVNDGWLYWRSRGKPDIPRCLH